MGIFNRKKNSTSSTPATPTKKEKAIYEYKMMEEDMSSLGIPIIRLESDYNEEDVEQLKIRIEAFIELIRMQK